MILIDTSIWIDHLRGRGHPLAALLEAGEVLMHPFVAGELACGGLRNRHELIELFNLLPAAPVATDAEAMAFIETHRLMARGIGYIDVHLLASAALGGTARLWTRDTRLEAVASELSLSFKHP